MNREERAQISRAIFFCRDQLEAEFDQLLRLYGLLPDRILPADRLPGERREKHGQLVRALEREGLEYGAARRRWVTHAAFTFLNRLLALRVAEIHGLIKETVITRAQYGGRSLRERDLADADPALATAPEDLARAALREAAQELAIPLLFSGEEGPYTLLEPRLPAYRAVRERIAAVPATILGQFEALGWAYQYFNSQVRAEIRSRLRRNPRPDDIPPLNQFYTVDWVVKFLVQNTLGRLWSEARPASPLAAKLDYLVPLRACRKGPGYRVKVEELKVLDPACGSGHFLLAAFDLLADMWREERPEVSAWEIPARILEHNLFGVDIDLRACQMAALALWLKARTFFERHKEVGAVFAPARLNIVCADVRFTDGNRRPLFLSSFDHDWDLRKIVDEILTACSRGFVLGSLLRIRQPLEELFASRSVPIGGAAQRVEQLQLQLPIVPSPEQLALHIPVPREVTIEEITRAVREFIRRYSELGDMGTMFFGLDAEQAVHLVDVLTERYDVILMNPPYGAMPTECREYARQHYTRTHSDYYAAFIEQAVDMVRPGGFVGALTGRTFMFLKSFQRLREEILRYDARPEAVLDLGFNVLDEATARYAAFTLRRCHPETGGAWEGHPVTFFRLTPWDWDEKRLHLERELEEMRATCGRSAK